MPQVRPEHYRTDEYNSVERFCSYAHQLKLIAGVDVQSILEVGPGTFLVSDALKRRGYDVTTCDFDPGLGADVTADVRKLPFGDSSFDLVMACQVLEHIPFEEFTRAIKELSRVTSRFAIISLPMRKVGFAAMIRFPFIETLFRKKHVAVSVSIAARFAGFEASRQHYWEIDAQHTPLKRVRTALYQSLKIVSEGSPPWNGYHYFFVLTKHEALV
jgi:SAM-dependent methyltransferase